MKSEKIKKLPRHIGDYHLLKLISDNGLSSSYIAARGGFELERLFFIETLRPRLARSEPEYASHFRDGAKTAISLYHGTLVSAFDVGSAHDEFYVATEFVDGHDLHTIWNQCAKKQVAFPVDLAVYIIKEVTRGLSYMHSGGNRSAIHKHIAPPNILISYDGDVKIANFYSASSTIASSGIVYGQVSYMSPEQARGEALDGRSDLYSAAVILWEMLTGRHLFPPATDVEQDLSSRGRNPIPVPPSSKAPRVPPALDAVCQRGLVPAREERYPDGETFCHDLSQWLRASASGFTDPFRLRDFLYNIFGEEIEQERAEREHLLASIR
ncbi:MAG: serine/threonine protein kinase [Proteobacteria bacterium]|nr:serine/threonine protein kinase [Pseudomonadota bacterium]